MIHNKIVLSLILVLSLFIWNGSLSSLELGIAKEVTEKPLHAVGKFPEWLEGVFVRNSAIPIYKEGKEVSHEFDGLAMLHRFAFNKGQVFYTNRFIRSEEYDMVVNQGSTDYMGFASKPTLWQRVRNFFTSSRHRAANAAVNVFKYGNSYVALTESPLPARFNLNSLETLGPFDFQDTLPKSQCWESAHPHLDPDTHEVVNYLIEYGLQSYYVVYRIKAGSTAREVIARIPVDMPSYMHSFAVTDHYCILTEFPIVVNPSDLLLGNKPFNQNFAWQPERGVRFLAIERSTGNVISQTVKEPFFSFHHANAYEVDHGKKILIDLVAYPDLSQMKHIFPEAAPSGPPADWQVRLMRYHYSLDENEILSENLLEKDIEFPRIDDTRDGKQYRYLYMALAENGSQGIGKLDLQTKQLKTWLQADCQAVEPVFVPSPNRQAEDEGILLTIVYNKNNTTSFLLALDAQTLVEVARAELPWQIPGSLHGQYFAENE